MAPKKKQQHQRQKQIANQKSSSSKSKSQSSDSKSTPKLQISAENERRLRRLLLNSDRPPAPTPPPNDTALSKSQKAKRLHSIYEKLSCEGFTADQIEQALSVLNDGATFEAALDWLCLNIPGHELPLKFSSGTNALSQEGAERSVSVISSAREDWLPSRIPSAESEEPMPRVSVRLKGSRDNESLDLGKPSQVDWIRQYVQQQEEEDWEALSGDGNDEGATEEVPDPSSRAISIAKEFQAARLAAVEAKEKKDKKSQEQAGNVIRRLKQEMSSLGLSDDILESGFRDESTLDCLSEAINMDSATSKESESDALSIARSRSELTAVKDHVIGADRMWDSSAEGNGVVVGPVGVPVPEKVNVDDESNEVDFSNLFSEDACVSESLPSNILKIQQKERMAQSAHGQSLGKLDELWKKGDSGKIPKAGLQQLCQRLGWEAPKYNRVSGKGNNFTYTVSVLRTASGRGKSRKAGGLITLQLPDSDETFESAEDSQNKVAAFALYQLFPNLPTYQSLLEPYSSLVKRWQEGETLMKVEETEEIRRAGFVDSLLSIDHTVPTNSATVVNTSIQEEHSKSPVQENNSTAKVERINYHKVENSFLKQEQENKMKLKKYKEMLGARATLPISELKSHFLKLLKENDVIVVCGETGCGKTTQVPQFILDDMIESNLGGYCSIVCTQPRRIAAISVAERVADERCESSPGSDGSLVGYQVRLDSARNATTKLLFCTTGILLRRLAGDKELSGISHIVVDEVHERSLLGDFLLIILKNLIERQSAHGPQKLKVILMSATVDAHLFSRYFGNCPVITAKGRTHPVMSYFLEDVYDAINYRLASDSPASLTTMASRREKVGTGRVDNHRGKKNLVMSGWGDESLLSESCINPHYDPTAYGSYGDRTCQNLRNLNEDVIDYDLLEDLVCYIDETYPGGAILVFLPGVAEIYMLVDKLAASYQFGGSSAEWILPLHSSLASADQRKVFQSPPENIRKVIVSTDIAETSITIDDVVYVIDCGKHKENRYNPQKKMSSMVEDWISQANAKQRWGRAGRVKPGICFCLYTRHRFEKLMRPYQVPEMLRMPLVELCLQIKSLSLGDIRTFLLKAIEPPREEAINSAIATLYELECGWGKEIYTCGFDRVYSIYHLMQEATIALMWPLLKVGAIEGGEELTPLGYHLAKLPVDVLIGKMMLYGCIFGCLSPILSIAGFLSYKPPFVYPKDEKQNVERAKLSLLMEKLDNVEPDEGNRQSDHLLMAIAYDKWVKILHEKGAKAANQFCSSYFLNSSAMYMIRDMRVQFGSLLADIRILSLPKLSQTDGKMKDKLDSWFTDLSQPFNMYSRHSSIVKSILCAGLYPNVAATEDGIVSGALSCNRSMGSNPTKGCPLWYDGRREVYIHPLSINNNVKDFQYPFLVFLEKVETSKVFLRDTSIISPYSILLFGGSINVQHQTGLVTIDGWLNLTAPAQTAVLFKELRLMLHSVLKELIRKPEMATVVDNEVVRSIIHLLLEEDKPQK